MDSPRWNQKLRILNLEVTFRPLLQAPAKNISIQM
jgi:hypothetical protein